MRYEISRRSRDLDCSPCEAPVQEIRGCDWPDCEGEGAYRAPRSRAQLRQYWWFCLDHVRQYNAAWNYYAGMNEAEVEADVRFDTVWQRPSWPFGQAIHIFPADGRRMGDGFGFFDEPPRKAPAGPRTAEGRAMVVLNLTPPVTAAVVKARYKELVKKHHPDANGGDKAAEERFKEISEAYRTVMNSLSP